VAGSACPRLHILTTRSNPQMLKRLMQVCSSEGVDCSDEGGLEAIIFTAEGDMRQALNNLQVPPIMQP
jgi:replication factor C subunit 2/4